MTAAPATIVLRMPNWLGDCVMAMPALEQLRRALPDAVILLAGRPHFRDLLSAQPGITGFVEAPASGVRHLLGGAPACREALQRAGVGSGKPDLALLFTNSLSTAVWAWRIGARRRLGYTLDSRRIFLSHPLPCGDMEQSWHFIHYYRWLAAHAAAIFTGESPGGAEDFAGQPPLPALAVGGDAQARAEALLKAAGIDGDYAVIAPASAYGPVKDWPPGHYRELVARLNREYSLPVVVTGGAGQAAVCDAIAADQAAAVSLAGKTDMDVFAGLLAGTRFFVGGDSGGAHVAAALGIPTVVIFGITNPTRTRPTGPHLRLLGKGEKTDVDLSSAGAREAARQALAGVTPDAVAAAAAELFRGCGSPPPAAGRGGEGNALGS